KATHLTINFPWGSLLEGLLGNESALLAGLVNIAHRRAQLEVRLNAGALAEAGWSLTQGIVRAQDALAANGFDMSSPMVLGAQELRSYPTTWAKRLAFGRDPRAVCLRGVKNSGPTTTMPVNWVKSGEREAPAWNPTK